jgi:hypothetical protein
MVYDYHTKIRDDTKEGDSCMKDWVHKVILLARVAGVISTVQEHSTW